MRGKILQRLRLPNNSFKRTLGDDGAMVYPLRLAPLKEALCVFIFHIPRFALDHYIRHSQAELTALTARRVPLEPTARWNGINGKLVRVIPSAIRLRPFLAAAAWARPKNISDKSHYFLVFLRAT